jgi:TolA-binding protein
MYNTNVSLQDNSIKYNTVGMRFENQSDGSTIVRGNVVAENNDTGIECIQYSDPLVFPNNVIRYDNFYGVYGDNTSAPDLGRYSDQGHNSIYYNGDDVWSTYSGTIYARYNWWGSYPANPLVSFNVDYSNALYYDPNPGLGKAVAEGMSFKNKHTSNFAADTLGMAEVNCAHEIFLSGDYEDALSRFERIVGKYPDHFSGRRALAFVERCLVKLGRGGQVLARLNAVALSYAGLEIAGLAQSVAVGHLVKSERYADAIAKSQTLLNNFPETTLAKYALYDLGSIYWYRLEDQKTGEQYYRQLIAQWPDDDLSISALATLGEGTPAMGKKNTPSLTMLSGVPTEYGLSQNFPNPFNPQTEIRYQLPEASRITVKIYNFLGQEVRTLVDGQIAAGYHAVVWDGQDDFGRKVTSGVYFYRLLKEPGARLPKRFQVTRKMILVQ